MKRLILLGLVTLFASQTFGQQSVARQWNEVLLEAIRNDFARPTVHARNLFHVSAAMYDAWAAYDTIAETYMLGKTVHGMTIPFNGIEMPEDIQAAREEAISYAAYRMIKHRFDSSPDDSATFAYADSIMHKLGYDPNMISWDYVTGPPGALGNYIAAFMINNGFQDGSNEVGAYENLYYETVNPPLILQDSGNPDIVDPNRWQPLLFDVFIDQSGNVIVGAVPDHLSPEWGNVNPFALTDKHKEVLSRDGHDYTIYHNPDHPPYLDTINITDESELYKWNFALVSIWSAHLDPTDGVMIDISPASIGNITEYPTDIYDYDQFYDKIFGGDNSTGYDLNPATGQPYPEQMVPRGDYARVLAEFWADGPDSETPPGHWFVIMNKVADHPAFQKRFKGEGEILDDLEWDVKAYFCMGGAMHDAAISAWSVKGYYDYVRPISAIRYMADKGQSTDPILMSYHPAGIPLTEGYVELVLPGDSLALLDTNNIGKIKVFAWRGHDYINNTAVDEAGVGWILAEDWWPYQRPSFVTPPFAGYVSGHSTYSKTAAEIMTALTGDEYFPGGVGQFPAIQDEFLVFEDGPSQTLVLQWAKYYDAADQCSLSRIWGGIHPPADDIRGRLMGEIIGVEAFEFAEQYFIREDSIIDTTDTSTVVPQIFSKTTLNLFPNPAQDQLYVQGEIPAGAVNVSILNLKGQVVRNQTLRSFGSDNVYGIDCAGLEAGIYLLRLDTDQGSQVKRFALID